MEFSIKNDISSDIPRSERWQNDIVEYGKIIITAEDQEWLDSKTEMFRNRNVSSFNNLG